MRKGKVFRLGKIEGVLVCLFSVGVKTVGFQPGPERERNAAGKGFFASP